MVIVESKSVNSMTSTSGVAVVPSSSIVVYRIDSRLFSPGPAVKVVPPVAGSIATCDASAAARQHQ